MEKLFKLEVEFGNDSMTTRRDLAAALRGLADKVQGGSDEGSIRDRNGNLVGHWSFETYD